MRIATILLSLSALVSCSVLATSLDNKIATTDNHSKNNHINTLQKTIVANGIPHQSWRFVDGFGREVYLRGFNVSGETKLYEAGFKPFRNLEDAQKTFSTMRSKTGANVARFLIAWEGVHPAPDQINYAYLDEVIKQIKVAIDNHIYVLLDYHQDLFSRYLFDKKSRFTGNGAPEWVVPRNEYPVERCFVCITWSQNNLTNPATRAAFRHFWDNAPFDTHKGERYLQDEFVWQLTQALDYISQQLTPEDFAHIIGLDPFNEPVDGGMEGLNAEQWDQQKLWPFYQRVRSVMNSAGWQEKLLFAEPLVYWNVNMVIVPATGGHHVQSPAEAGYVFNSHFYDTSRMGINPLPVTNTEYVDTFNQIREEADFIHAPSFVSEFGMNIQGNKRHDAHTMIHAMYQGMEASLANDDKTRQSFYSPFVSSTQWHWDIYHNQHHELMNGNADKMITTGDAWNDEDFSVVTNGGTDYTIDKRVVERVYPRRVQGDLMSFYYNDLAHDQENTLYQWAAISHPGIKQIHYANNQFALLIWREEEGEAPTEVFIPSSLENVSIVTEQFVLTAAELMREQTFEKYHTVLAQDTAEGGYRLLIWPTASTKGNLRFTFIVANADAADLPNTQLALVETIIQQQKNPVVFLEN